MKKILFLLLIISNTVFSQNQNFSVEKNTLLWKINLGDSFQVYKEKLENNPKLEIIKSSGIQIRGNAKNLKCNCSGVSNFMKEEFDAEFIVNLLDDKISVSVFNLRFKSFDHYVFETVRTKVEIEPIEKYIIKKDNSIRDNRESKKILDCLDKYFDLIFR